MTEDKREKIGNFLLPNAPTFVVAADSAEARIFLTRTRIPMKPAPRPQKVWQLTLTGIFTAPRSGRNRSLNMSDAARQYAL